MFTAVSWKDFALTLFLLLLVYYLVILLLYFRGELMQLLANLLRNWRGNNTHAASTMHSALPQIDQQHADPLFQLVQHLVDRLKATIANGVAREQPKAELLMAIAKELQPYGMLVNTVYQKSVSQLIERALFLQCTIRLDAHDLARLWQAGDSSVKDSSKPQS
jgi:hypothetical protein